jgi:toxin secretion/phage lysis holin
MKVWLIIEAIFAAISGTVAAFLGGYDGLLTALVIFTVIDYITGVFNAIVQKSLSSQIGYKGIIRKVVMFFMVAVAHLIDEYLLNLSVGGGEIIRDAVICFFLANEGLSIMENAALIGLPIPKTLKNILLQLREKEDKKKSEENNDENDDWDND